MKTGKSNDLTSRICLCVTVETHLHPQGDVVHFQGGVRVVQVHLQANSLAGDGRQDGGVVGGGAHIQGVVASAACFGQLKTRTCSFTVYFRPQMKVEMEETGAYLLKQQQGGGVSDGGGRVGHGTHHGHSSRQSCCCTRREVLLMGGSRLPQVHVHVDQT